MSEAWWAGSSDTPSRRWAASRSTSGCPGIRTGPGASGAGGAEESSAQSVSIRSTKPPSSSIAAGSTAMNSWPRSDGPAVVENGMTRGPELAPASTPVRMSTMKASP